MSVANVSGVSPEQGGVEPSDLTGPPDAAPGSPPPASKAVAGSEGSARIPGLPLQGDTAAVIFDGGPLDARPAAVDGVAPGARPAVDGVAPGAQPAAVHTVVPGARPAAVDPAPAAGALAVQPAGSPVAKVPAHDGGLAPPVHSSPLTAAALWGAMGLAFIGILGGLVLCVVLVVRGMGSTDILTIRMLLSCVAIFVGTAFGALGFALFLIKAEGAFRAKMAGGDSRSGMIDTTAPGLIVFLCATVIIYLSLHMQFNVEPAGAAASPSVHSAAAPVGGAAGGDMELPTPLTPAAEPAAPPAGGGSGSR
jgi:hypothetical protein